MSTTELDKGQPADHAPDPEQPEALPARSVKDREEAGEELDLEWFERSTGYDSRFLGKNFEVPFPKLRADLKQDVAPLKNGGTILHYTHFSIMMSKSRCLAFYTAVNVDGSQLVDVEREKDRWYFDPRIDQKYQYGPELYNDNDIDRGHLVRRRDPAWGSAAAKANVDTFHFTNCSPQHKSLNQKTWLELEDYILENARNRHLKVSVFTGPVFRSDDILYREKFQIPAEFWKVAVMVKENGQLSATAYLQTQKQLIVSLQFAYGKYKTYQVPISKIEALTGLNFNKLQTCDPLYRAENSIGHVIETADDIRL
ncbi:hypothetical protein P22_1917 [Propionispora sp. 2/2-37]|uniref:DNA/RNA non-specific endonuclease n=1 Tax=Propionispora sp. 2/2-37 TaxID=1677858 RepID=UPI0006BB6A75|nr:DNA/RNA non-specific endonuclease [Propionispora sp. 2/2-37]CUH95832.1 hypothetical protein P22_1917 [Propionispora sp. 2/2-37]